MGAGMSQVFVFHQLFPHRFPTLNLRHTAPGIFIEGDVEGLDELWIAVLDEIGQILGIVFTGFRHVVAKLLHDLIAHHVIVLVGASRCSAFNLGIEIFTAASDFQKPSHMVDTSDFPLYVFRRHAQTFQKARHADLHTVAETNCLHSSKPLHVASEDRHGVDVIEEPRIRTDLFDVTGKLLKYGQRAQSTENPADP